MGPKFWVTTLRKSLTTIPSITYTILPPRPLFPARYHGIGGEEFPRDGFSL
jgi:hypothetical protein